LVPQVPLLLIRTVPENFVSLAIGPSAEKAGDDTVWRKKIVKRIKNSLQVCEPKMFFFMVALHVNKLLLWLLPF
jgi:hypothetical protein